MLRYKDFETELKKMKDDKSASASVVKGIELLGKFLRDVRSNQVRIMSKLGVDLRTGKVEDTKPTTDKATDTPEKTKE